MTFSLVFAGTPSFAKEILAVLIETPFKPRAIFTQPDRPQGRGQKILPSPVKVLAEHHNIPIFQPVTLKDPESQQLLRDLKPDLLVVVAYGLILPQAVLDIPSLGCMNVHASLLPRWRGAAPIQAAILAGDKETGITIMQMDKGLDTGDILLRKICPIYPEDNSQSLHDRLATLGAEALLDTLSHLQSGPLVSEKQEDTKACYAGKIQKHDAKILWEKETAAEIVRKVRAFNPWPVAFFEYSSDSRVFESQALKETSDPIRVFEAEVFSTTDMSETKAKANEAEVNEIKVSETQMKAKPGTLLAISDQGLDVSTSLGVVRLLKIQLPGKKPISIKDFLNAHPKLFKVGIVFN